MSDLRPFESHLSREAVAFVVGLSKKRQRLVLDLADQLARQPSKIGDYKSVDAVGRPIENIRLEGYLFSYWEDHLTREVRITEIARL
jgi:hypothetical protein